MKFALRCLALSGLLTVALRATDGSPATAAPRKAELGVYILDITDIDEPGGKFTLQVLLGVYWQDPTQAFVFSEQRAPAFKSPAPRRATGAGAA